MSGADPAAVAAAADEVLAAIVTASDAAAPSLKDRLLSMKDLMAVAAADFEGGVEDGKVTFAMEYRDAWGFVQVIRAEAETLAASSDAAEAEAGKAVLEQVASVDPLFDGVMAETAGTDIGLLAAAAGWIEIIALKAK